MSAEYPYITAYHFAIKRGPNDIDRVEAIAVAENAPSTAMYKMGDDWVLFETLEDSSLKDEVVRLVERDHPA